MRRILLASAALGTLFMLQGCIAAVGYAVGQAEAERLNKLELWTASLERLDCGQLAEVDAELRADKENFVDFDQREDILTEKREAKNCIEA